MSILEVKISATVLGPRLFYEVFIPPAQGEHIG